MRPTLVLPFLVLLSGCGGDGAGPTGKADRPAGDPKRSVSSDLPKGVKPSASVLEMRKIAGVWRSAPGAIEGSPKQSLQLEMAFDRSFSMTLWGRDPKGAGEAVFARQAGRFGETGGGIAGSASKAAPSAISFLSSWSLRADRDGAMVLTPPGGRGIVLRRIAN